MINLPRRHAGGLRLRDPHAGGRALLRARVNGKMVTLRHGLRNGDTVEVMTSPAQKPRKDWLEFVVSGKARSKIRHATRSAENERSRELGRDLLERELRRAGLSLARLLESGELEPVAGVEVKGGVEELFSAVGYGKLPAAQVLRRLRPDAAPAPPEPEKKRRGLFRRPAVVHEPGSASAAWETCWCASASAARRWRATRWWAS